MDINPYLPPQAEILVAADIEHAEQVRRAHIKHETSVWLWVLLVLIVVIIMMVGMMSVVSRG
jgi:hypothetical protein